MRKNPAAEGGPATDSKKVRILVPASVYSVYEEIARDEHITVAQVIARVAIEFVELERHASQSRRASLGNYKDELFRKARQALRTGKK
jgi:hypothetical protein